MVDKKEKENQINKKLKTGKRVRVNWRESFLVKKISKNKSIN